MAIGMMPSNFQQTYNILWKFADDIWTLSGDRYFIFIYFIRDLDHNYQTKRIIFISNYASSEVFMLTDMSENYQETWNFLNRRIENVIVVGQTFN